MANASKFSLNETDELLEKFDFCFLFSFAFSGHLGSKLSPLWLYFEVFSFFWHDFKRSTKQTEFSLSVKNLCDGIGSHIDTSSKKASVHTTNSLNCCLVGNFGREELNFLTKSSAFIKTVLARSKKVFYSKNHVIFLFFIRRAKNEFIQELNSIEQISSIFLKKIVLAIQKSLFSSFFGFSRWARSFP